MSEEMESKLLASTVYHNTLFNNFLGKEEYAHYINKFSRSNAVATTSGASSSLKLMNRASINKNNSSGQKIATSSGGGSKRSRGSISSANQAQSSSGMIDQKVSAHLSPASARARKSMQQKQQQQQQCDVKGDAIIDVSTYRIASATKIGSRKHQMLNEIWKVGIFYNYFSDVLPVLLPTNTSCIKFSCVIYTCIILNTNDNIIYIYM
jgi:hypothetical protein